MAFVGLLVFDLVLDVLLLLLHFCEENCPIVSTSGANVCVCVYECINIILMDIHIHMDIVYLISVHLYLYMCSSVCIHIYSLCFV